MARPCTLPLGSTHLPPLSLTGSVDPCGMLDLITFTFKQTAPVLWRQSAMSSDREAGFRHLEEKADQEIKALFVSFLYR